MSESGLLSILKGAFKPFDVKEFTKAFGEKTIYGQAFIPHGKGPFPVCVICHGLGGTHAGSVAYAQDLAACGVVCVIFDFCGGAPGSKSSGTTHEMSVMTEASDLEDVLDYVLGWDFVDASHVWLMGRSQGGAVAALVAARRTEQIEKLVLLYPAFNITSGVREILGSLEDVPETFELLDGSIEVGRSYAKDMWDYDWRESAHAFAGPVLLIHGTADALVDPAFSEEAVEEYADAALARLEGAPHGFEGEYLETAQKLIREFLLKREDEDAVADVADADNTTAE